jgi:hypothetical protein
LSSYPETLKQCPKSLLARLGRVVIELTPLILDDLRAMALIGEQEAD